MTSTHQDKSDPAVDAAIGRARVALNMLIGDVQSAIDARAVLEAGNNLLNERGTIAGAGAETYNIIRNNLALGLSLTVARMFDLSQHKPIERQTKASIPVVAYWLRVPGVRQSMVSTAERWVEFLADLNVTLCGEQLDKALAIADRISSDEMQMRIHRRVRETRDARLAHSLFDKDPVPPFYADIFGMLNDARDFTAHISTALLGRNSDFENMERNRMIAARKFWLRALSASWLPTDGNTVQID